MKDQKDCVLNVLEELGNKWLFLKHQCNTDISFSLLLLLPIMLSIDCQTNKKFVQTQNIFFHSPQLDRSVIFSLYFLRMSKKMDYYLQIFVRRERVIPWFNINPIPCFHRNDARWITSKFSSLRFRLCFLSACKILHLQLSLLFKSITIYLIHEKFWPIVESCLPSKTKFWLKSMNPASMQNLLTLSICERLNSFFKSLQLKIMICWVVILQKNFCFDFTEQFSVPSPYQVALIDREKIHIPHTCLQLLRKN